MTDYDLGKARGRIVIDVDERGFRRAERANDALADSAHRVAEGYVDVEKAQEEYEKQTKRTQKAQESLNRRQNEAQKALNRLNESQELVNRLKKEGKVDTDRYKKAVTDATKAKNRYSEAVTEAANAESKFNNEINETNKLFSKLDQALQSNHLAQTTRQIKSMNTALGQTKKNSKIKVDVDSDDALTRLKALRKEHDGLIRSMRTVGGLAGGTLKVGSGVMGGAALAGAAGLAAGGLTGYGVNGIMATAAGIGQLSGILGLLPIVIGNLGASIGTIIIASQNMGDAFSAVAANDAEKFNEALKKMSANGQEFAWAFNEIYPALEDFQRSLQEGMFRDLAGYMRDLAQQYLPMLKESFTGFAEIINGTIKDLGEWLKQADVFADIQIIMNNLTETMSVLAPTARIIAEAFLDIMKVSSDFGPELANSFKEVVTQFRDWIRTLRNNGDLARWIQTGIESFGSLMRSLKVFGEAFGRIFEIQGQYGGGLFGFLERIANALNEWTKSAEGNKALNDFFRSMTDLSKALTPVLGSLANLILGTIIPALAQLGTNLAPGLKVFFDTLGVGFRILGETLNDPKTVEALNQFMGTIAGTFTEIIKQLGPQIPDILRALSDAIAALAPLLPMLATSIAMMMPDLVRLLEKLSSDEVIQAINNMVDFINKISAMSSLFGGGLVGSIRAITIVMEGLFNVIDEKTGGVLGSLANLITGITNWGVDVAAGILDAFAKITKVFIDFELKAFDWGKKIFSQFIDGMLDQLGPIGRAAKTIMDKLAEWLPSSPAKKGPFSGQGYSKIRGQKLASDFAAGIDRGSEEANVAGGTLAKSTESGIQQFVQDMLQFSSFGQQIAALFQDIANNVFAIAEIATTNPITGESVFGKSWRRTVSDADLKRQQEDRAYQDQLDRQKKQEDERRKMLRQPTPRDGMPHGTPSAEGPLRRLLPESAAGRYMGDKALLSRINPGPGGPQYISQAGFGDLTEGLGDCTSTIEDLINIMDGKPTEGRSMATGNAPEWLAARGFVPTDTPMPGTFQVGFFNDPSAPGGGHMQATLPDGTKWNWGDNASARLSAAGRGNSGAWDDPRFNRFYYRPVNGGMRNALPPAQPDNAESQRKREPGVGTGPLPGPDLNEQFKVMNENLDKQLSQQEIMIKELRDQNPLLEEAIRIGENPNATDAQIGAALDTISMIADQQRKMDTAQSRFLADGLDSVANKIAGNRGMSQVQTDPIGTVSQIFNGVMGLVGSVFKVVDSTLNAIDGASQISRTLVRGIENTEDIYGIVEQIQKFITLGASVAQAVGDGLALAGQIAGASGGTDSGGVSGILSAASGIAGIVSSAISAVNATIDLVQEGYRIATKYIGRMVSFMVGGGNGSLMGDVKFLLDERSRELKTWSGDNPADKRSFGMFTWPWEKMPQQQTGKIRDLNMYIGPGTDPNEAMSAAMWSIKTDQNGVFTSASY